MKKNLFHYLVAIGFVLFTALSPTASAATCSNDKSLLGFPPWFHGLQCETKNGVESVVLGGNINKVWVIVMNVAQWVIVAAGYVAVYFIAWSGFKYIVAQGDPQKITEAKNTLANAIIGLIIVLAAVAIVRTVQASISGTIT